MTSHAVSDDSDNILEGMEVGKVECAELAFRDVQRRAGYLPLSTLGIPGAAIAM